MGYFKPYYESQKGYYDNKCASCEHYQIKDIDSAYNDGYKCELYTHKRLAFDDSCHKYSWDRSRTQNDIKKAFNKLASKYGRYQPHSYSWWHITTVVCEILGINNYYKYIEAGVKFKTYYLETSISEIEFLASYDYYGLLIADKLLKEENKEEIAFSLLTKYIEQFYQAFISNDIYNASLIYKTMYYELKEHYFGNGQKRKLEK